MKIKPALIILVALLGLVLSAGLAVLSTRFNGLPREFQLVIAVVILGVVILFSFLMRGESRKSGRLARQALEELGVERENWISRQYRGRVNGHEYEIMPFRVKGFVDTQAIQILLRGAFNPSMMITLPKGLSEFVIWGAETGIQVTPAGYSGLSIYTDDRIAAGALLDQPEMRQLVMELFDVSTQTPLVLEIGLGVIRLRAGRLAQLGFDEQALRRWLQILTEIGKLAGMCSLPMRLVWVKMTLILCSGEISAFG